MLERIEESIFEIQSALWRSDVLKKCLYYDSNNALNMSSPATENLDVNDYITVEPIYDITEDYNKNAIIQLELDNADNVDNTIDGIIRVNIVMNKNKWFLVDKHIRPLTIANEVIRILDGKKFSISNTLVFTRILPLILNKNVSGYALLFELEDGVAEETEL